MNYLHRATLRFPRTAAEAFKDETYARAIHGPYTSEGPAQMVSRAFWLAGGVFLLLSLVLFGVMA
jgi:hypothetical protein